MTVRRAPWLIVSGAVAGFAGVLSLRLGAAAPVASAPAPAGGSAVARAPRSPGSSSPAGSRAPSPRSTASQTRTRTATGPDVNFSYGTISVRVTVRGSRIVNVSVASISVLEPTSGQISGQAIPVLRSEVLAAQSASIHGVSGATYTSQGYHTSLQAALHALNA